MTPTGPQNIPHSVRDRLMNLARRTGQDYNRLLVRYALERLLYRLSISNHAGRFVLKGAITPSTQPVTYPVLLDYPAPAIQAYPKETVIAEKFEAMVSLELLNTRMKDFADIWYMSRHFTFDGATLARAISETFARRGTAIDPSPVALTDAFADSARQMQWAAFLRRTTARDMPTALADVVTAAARFLLPVSEALATGSHFTDTWSPLGDWQSLTG